MTEYHHIYELFDPSKYIQSFELEGADRTLTIKRIGGETIEGEANRKARKPVIYFSDWSDGRGFVLNKTNARTIISLYGPDYRSWVGKRIVLFPTTTKMAGEEVDCIRLRKVRPQPVTPTRSTPSARTLPERIAAFRDALKSAKTEQEVKDVIAKASGLFDAVDSETKDALGREWNARLDDVRVIEQQKKEQAS